MDVLAWVGSRDYFQQDARGAIDYVRTRRSPGSALKPFLYALAMEQGATAATELPDVAAEFDVPGGAWLPENYNHGYFGPMLLREALANSRNLPALRILSEVGVEPALRFFERAGVRGISWEPGRYGLGLALGGLETTVEELAGLYAALARDGEHVPLRFFADDAAVQPRRVLSRDAARTVRHILADPSARRPTFPAGGSLDYDYAVAVKTGTSQGFRDAWTVAFSDRLLVGVWLGNHDRRRMAGVSGARAAAAVHEIMDAVMPERSPQRPPLVAFPPPDGFVSAAICPLSGRLAGPGCPSQKAEHFAPGTQPWQACPWHVRVRVDRRNGLRAGRSCPPRFVDERAMLDLPEDYARWAASQHLEIAPRDPSPLCAEALASEAPAQLRIREPRAGARYLWDPETPPEASGIRLSARATPADQEVVWIVDGSPVARVRWPHELHWALAPGRHTVAAALAGRPVSAGPVTVFVEN